MADLFSIEHGCPPQSQARWLAGKKFGGGRIGSIHTFSYLNTAPAYRGRGDGRRQTTYNSPTCRTIVPRVRGHVPSRISCAARASARGRTVPIFVDSCPEPMSAVSDDRRWVVTSTRKNPAVTPRG